MKENKKFKALKAGLGNGLVIELDRAPVAKRKKVKIDNTKWAYNQTVDEHYLTVAGYTYGFDEHITPHFFPLPMLTKPIRIEVYNGGKEFVPMTELEDLFGSKFWIGNNFDGEILIQTLGTDKYLLFREMNQIVSMLHQWHFNIFNLDESEFIDASISKCYEPK